MKRYCLLGGWALLVSLELLSPAIAQDRSSVRHRRAKLPVFESTKTSKIFFDDIFRWLVGDKPTTRPIAETSPSVPRKPEPNKSAVSSVNRSGVAWSKLVSATTIEDEVKALKLDIDQVVTTPGSFAGRDHKQARIDFSLLAMLFAVIDEYDADVRWKTSAGAARDLFARTASNLKAGGAIQVYNESRKRKQDLDDLIRGSKLPDKGSDDSNWPTIVDRTPLMQILDGRLEGQLRPSTSRKSEFEKDLARLEREAELAGVVAEVLAQEGMDDASDEDYQAFVDLLRQGAAQLRFAIRSKDFEAAGAAMNLIRQSCTDCHDNYR